MYKSYSESGMKKWETTGGREEGEKCRTGIFDERKVQVETRKHH